MTICNKNVSRLALVPWIALGLFAATPSYAKVKAPQLEDKASAQSVTAERVFYPESNLYQKPGSPIRYSYSIAKSISVGQSVTIDVTLSEPFESGNLTVNCTARGDVRLQGGDVSSSFNMSGNSRHEMQVTFTAGSLGLHYVQFQALSETSDQGARPRYFSIPVQVGPVQPRKPNPNLKVTPSGRTIISMQAKEDIR